MLAQRPTDEYVATRIEQFEKGIPETGLLPANEYVYLRALRESRAAVKALKASLADALERLRTATTASAAQERAHEKRPEQNPAFVHLDHPTPPQRNVLSLRAKGKDEI